MAPHRKAAGSPQDFPEGEEAGLIRAHLAAVAFIEAHLFEPMTVKSIADHAGFSPSRFSRGFTRIQGESVMAYVRGRRLEGAMRRILTEPRTALVDLAFDCGFDSQEAFTRAFARAFGHPPGRLRSLGEVRSVTRRKRSRVNGFEIHERVEQVPELHLAGIARRFTPANYGEMPQIWRRLDDLRGFAGQVDDGATYSVVLELGPESGSTQLLAGLRITTDCAVPPGLQRLTLPAGPHVVFRHVLGKGDIYPQVTMARELIRTQYLPESGHALADGHGFEVFPNGLAVTPGSWIDHYFPLRETSR